MIPSFKNAVNVQGVKLLAHWMGWFGEPNKVHRVSRYASNDVGVINAQLSCMQAVGIDGVIVTYQGTVNSFLLDATIKLSYACTAKGMLFALLLDPWIAKGQANPTQVVIDQMNGEYFRMMLSCPAYIPEKYVLEFDLGPAANVNVSQVQAAFPNIPILSKHKGYSWPEINNTVPILKSDNANPLMKIPGVFVGFNDAGFLVVPPALDSNGNPVRDYCHSVWDKTVNARVIDHQAGNAFFDSINALPVAILSPYVAIVTWNDHDEGTGIEQFCSAITGIRIGK